jgi:hypothetical protein
MQMGKRVATLLQNFTCECSKQNYTPFHRPWVHDIYAQHRHSFTNIWNQVSKPRSRVSLDVSSRRRTTFVYPALQLPRPVSQVPSFLDLISDTCWLRPTLQEKM